MGMLNSNMLNSEFHFIQIYCKVFQIPISLECMINLKTVKSKFHYTTFKVSLIQSVIWNFVVIQTF